MARTEQLEQHQRKQRRLALLALLAHRPQRTGACLEDETLAALVEGTLEQPEVDRCLAHMAECDRCSSIWLQLDHHWQSLQPQKKGSKIHQLLTRPKVLAALGSSLAVAASIAVFLSITTRMDQSQLLHQPLHQEQMFKTMPPDEPSHRGIAMPSPAPAPAPAGEQLQKKQEEIAPQVGKAAPFAQKEDRPRQQLPRLESARKQRSTDAAAAKEHLATESAADFLAQEREPLPLAAAPQPLPETAARTVPRAQTLPSATKAGAGALNLETWKIRLRHGCGPLAETKDLAPLAEQGRQLLAAGYVDKPQQELIEAILDQLAANNPPGQRCRRILELIGPERTEKKR